MRVSINSELDLPSYGQLGSCVRPRLLIGCSMAYVGDSSLIPLQSISPSSPFSTFYRTLIIC
jgi:hypothetical protein